MNFLKSIGLLFITFCLLFHEASLQNCKWPGMKATYLTDANMEPRGLAARNPLRLAYPGWSDAAAGLIYTGSISLVSNFHIHFQAYVNPSTDGSSWAFDGIAINLGKTRNVYSGAGGGCIGYCNIQNAYVIEFDYYHNGNGDINGNHLSLHPCLYSTCNSNEGGHTVQRDLPGAYRHDRSRGYTLDVHVTFSYRENLLSVYLGNLNSPIVQQTVDLPSAFGGTAYLGFSTFIRGRRRSIWVSNSYVCEGGDSWARPTTYVMSNNIIYTNYKEFIAGSVVYLYFKYNDVRSRNLNPPTVESPCEEGIQLANYGNDRVGKVLDCNQAGKKTFTINDRTFSGSTTFSYGIIPGALCKFRYYGHDGKAEPDDIKTVGSVTYFKWGDIGEKDFETGSFSDGYFRALFMPEDCYGNVLDDIGEDSQELLAALGLSTKMDGGAPEIKVSKKESKIYEIAIKVSRSGTFTVSSSKLLPTTSMAFYVHSGKPSEKSYCTTGKNTPTLRDGELISYDCVLIDEWGTKMNPKVLQENLKTQFSCTISKTSPKVKQFTAVPNINETIFSCNYTAGENGAFNFEAAWKKPTTGVNKISSVLNSFNVIPEPSTIATANIFSFTDNRWYENDKIPSVLMYEKMTSIGEILAIDLIDVDGTSFTEIGYNMLDINKFSGLVHSDHAKGINEEKLIFSETMINGKKYIYCYVEKPDTAFTLSSFDYNVTIKYRDSKLDLKFKTPLEHVGDYKACQHPFNAKTSEVELAQNTEKRVNSIVKIGNLVLRTDDSNLYNYFIDDSTITFVKTPNNEETKVYVSRSSTVNGVYDFYIKTTVAKVYDIKVLIKGVEIGGSKVQVDIKPLETFDSFDGKSLNDYSETSENEYTLKTVYTADESPVLYFKGKDKFGNDMVDAPSSSNSNLGISYKVYVNNEEVSADITIELDDKEKKYKIKDNIKKSGEYKVILTSKTLKTITFKYTKKPGKISKENTIFTVTNSYQIKLKTFSYVSVELRDSYGNNIGTDNETFEEERAKITMSASNDKNNILSYTYNKKDGLNALFRSEEATVTGLFTLSGKIDKSDISKCNSCSFEVVYALFDIKSSVVKAIINGFIPLNEKSVLNVKADSQRPMFQFEFFNKKGDLVDYVDPETEMEATIKKDSETIQLTKSWVTYNTLLFTFENSVNVKDMSGVYTLSIKHKEEEKTSKINFIKGDKDYDDSAEIEVDKTYVSSDRITVVAGETGSFTVELRTSGNLRYDKDVTASELTVKNDKEYTDKELKITTQKGPKKGQIIVNVVPIKTATFEEPITLSLLYKNQQIPTTIKVVSNPGDLSYFGIKESSFKDQSKKELKDGTTEEIPVIAMVPYDKYGNVDTKIIQSNDYPEDSFSQFITAQLGTEHVSISSSVNPSKNEIDITLSSKFTGVLTLSSVYFKGEKYTLNVLPGKISSSSTGYISDKKEIKAGENIHLIINPRDSNGNFVTDVTEEDAKLFEVFLQTPTEIIHKEVKFEIKTGEDGFKYIDCSIPVEEAGNTIVKVKYNGHDIKLKDNIAKVSSAEVDYANTQLMYNSKFYEPSSAVSLLKSSFPFLYIQLYDKYKNKISTKDIEVSFTDDIFCVERENSYNLIKVCKDKFVKWNELPVKTEYELSLDKGAVTYKITATGDIDKSVTANEVDFSRTTINKDKLSIKAGESGTFMVELKASNNLRKNEFYPNPNAVFKIIFSKNDEVYTTNVSYGEKFGQYIVSVKSKKAYEEGDKNTISFQINGKAIKPTVQLVVEPSDVVLGYFINSKGEKITNGQFPQGKADELYTLRAVFFDEYKNAAAPTDDEFSFEVTAPKPHENSLIKTTKKLSTDSTYTITIDPVNSGEYVMSSNLFEESYKFTVSNGEISGANSYLKVAESSKAGEEVTAYIVLFDEDNNYITPTEEKAKSFNVFYRYPTDTNTYSNYINVDFDKIGEVNGVKALGFKTKLTKQGKTYFNAVFSNSNIKCTNCVVEISATTTSTEKSVIKKYNPSSNSFVEITGNQIEYNKNDDGIFRFYPKDQFGNSIDTSTLKESIGSIQKDNAKKADLTITTKTEEYIEFTASDDTYKTLPGGDYKITVTTEGKTIEKQFTLAGDPEDPFYKNQELDVSKTAIIESNTEYAAGASGFFVLEFRTKNNLIYNSENIPEIKVENCNEKDKAFEYKALTPSKYCTMYVKVNTTLSNSFPEAKECLLTITINSQKTDLKPQMIVNPGALSSAKIDKSYLKSEDSFELKDGNADTPLLFKVIGYDVHMNVAKVSESSLKISVRNSKNETITSTSTQDVSTGYQSYLVAITKQGDYKIYAGTNEDGDYLFKNSYSIHNSYGKVSQTESVISVKESNIIAGEKASIEISPRDKNLNQIPVETVKDSFKVSIKTATGKDEVNVEDVTVKDNNLVFTTTLTEKGETKWIIKMDNKTIDFSGTTDVSPSTCSPERTIVYMKDSEGKYNLASTPLRSSQKVPLGLSLTFKDKYENIIESVSLDIQIQDSVLSGHYMTPITYESTISGDNTQIYLALPEKDEYSFNHLVQKEDYDFKFKVKFGNEIKQFDFKVNHTTSKDDTGYGNGIYVPSQTKLNRNNLRFKARSKEDKNEEDENNVIEITLATAQGNIYNDDIKYNGESPEIKCIPPKDNTFSYKISKISTNYGTYKLSIYSEKASTTEETVTIQIINPTTKAFVTATTFKYTTLVADPDPKKTVLSKELEAAYDYNSKIVVGIQMTDRFGNQYIDNQEALKYLFLIINQRKITSFKAELGIDKKTYNLEFSPIAERNLNITILFQENASVDLFGKPLKTSVSSKIVWDKTQIASSNINEMKADKKLDINIFLYDALDMCVTSIDSEIKIVATVTGPIEYPNKQRTINYNFVPKIKTNATECQLSFLIEEETSHTEVGTYLITIKAGDTQIGTNYYQKITPGEINVDGFVSQFSEDREGEYVKAGEEFKFNVIAYDKFGNKVNESIKESFSVKIKDEEGNEVQFSREQLQRDELNDKSLEYIMHITKTGGYDFEYFYKEEKLSTIQNSKGPSKVFVIPNKCSRAGTTFDTSNLSKAFVSKAVTIKVFCKDEYGNSLTLGGDDIGANVIVRITTTEVISQIKKKVKDLGDGKYEISFTPPLEGEYTVKVLLDEEQIGDDIIQEIKEKTCGEGEVLCPNVDKCVSDAVECIEPANDCPKETPFKCSVNGEQACTKSQTDCDCPEGKIRCGYNNYCVDKDKEEQLCPFVLAVNCQKYKDARVFCEDGICRNKKEYSPNKRVCPIGLVLCPDLTCRSNYDACATDYPECADDEVKCEDQTCVTDQKNCPSMVTCSDKNMVVCPDGSCVENEIYCKALPTCEEETPFLCNTNSCTENKDNCPKSVSCGHGKSLCYDKICRTIC